MAKRKAAIKKRDQVTQYGIFGVEPKLFEDLHPITIIVVGCGGTGSLILSRLARLHQVLVHLGRKGLSVVAYDPDVVEPWNVGRQLFTQNDIGLNKAEALISKINMAFGVNWECIKEAYQGYSPSNFIISATDTVASRQVVKDSWLKTKLQHFYGKPLYWIDCGNGKDFGQIVLTDRHEILADIFDIAPDIDLQQAMEHQGIGCSFQEKLNEQDVFINDEMALIAVDMIWKMLYYRQIDYNVVYTNYQTMDRKKGLVLKK